MDVGQAIKARREQKGIAWDELARRSGVPKRTMFHWTKGQDPSVTKFVAVARALGDTPSRLLEEAEVWSHSAQ